MAVKYVTILSFFLLVLCMKVEFTVCREKMKNKMESPGKDQASYSEEKLLQSLGLPFVFVFVFMPCTDRNNMPCQYRSTNESRNQCKLIKK